MTPITTYPKPKSSTAIDNNKMMLPTQQDIVIFLVDDDPIYLQALEFQFRENPSLVVKTFLTGEACIEKLSLKPDVIILDYFLDSQNTKGMDGLHTLMTIKRTAPNTQVIMLSSNETVEVATHSLKLGAFDYVVKNQKTFLHLKRSIKKVLGIYSKEKELIVWDW
jgi:two-component system OmpR family response regulator